MLTIVAVPDHVIIIAVPDKRIRTDNVVLTVMPQLFIFAVVVICILKADLAIFIDGFVDAIQDIECFLVFRLNTALNRNMPTEFLSIIIGSQ